MKHQQNYHTRIIVDPAILGGKPVIKGTRIPVEIVIQRLAHDLDTQTVFEDYPRLTKGDIQACLAYAQELIKDETESTLFFEKETSHSSHI
jgi:uncharacterized protein (DUF433 family)